MTVLTCFFSLWSIQRIDQNIPGLLFLNLTFIMSQIRSYGLILSDILGMTSLDEHFPFGLEEYNVKVVLRFWRSQHSIGEIEENSQSMWSAAGFELSELIPIPREYPL